MIEKFKPPAADTEVVHCFSREEREERVEVGLLDLAVKNVENG